MAHQSVFAFGAPVLPSKPSASGQRDIFVLGAYPSGLHISWTPPQLEGLALKPLRAMIVDNEPIPFWDGSNAPDYFEAWRRTVDWQDEWGAATLAAASSNGPSGKWVVDHILTALGAGPDEVCISDCLDESRLNDGQSARIGDTYAPVAERLGLPACSLRPVPKGENALVQEAVAGHLDRLRAEIRDCQPRIVVTLGNAALRVASHVLELERQAPAALSRESYGSTIPAEFEGCPVEWLPLVHPRSGERTPPWPDIHRVGSNPRALHDSDIGRARARSGAGIRRPPTTAPPEDDEATESSSQSTSTGSGCGQLVCSEGRWPGRSPARFGNG